MGTRLSSILGSDGQPFKHMNGKKPRMELIKAQAAASRPKRSARLSYDAARDSDWLSRYWPHADRLDADSANSRDVRHKLISRSRYEDESNALYNGLITKYVNMLMGVGPTLRMLTSSKPFNQAVEKAWFAWSKAVGLTRKLRCMAHARTLDGEAFALLINNPSVENDRVQLDLQLIEAEQVQTPYIPHQEPGYIDGIKFDEDNNIQWYDVLPYHPGSLSAFLNVNPLRILPNHVLHWFRLTRPGQHRGKPDLTASMNCGAAFRRLREAALDKAEKEANFTLFLKTMFQPEEIESVIPMDTLNIEKGVMTALPNSVEPHQLDTTAPGDGYIGHHRTLVAEQASPLTMPYNAAAGDSSTYSFASGKLDTLIFRNTVDIDRQDCDELTLDPLFAEWFREWNLADGDRASFTPLHQWDWPAHPVIDEVAHANAIDTQLKNGTITHRQVSTDGGHDYEEELRIKAEDTLGDATEENIAIMRKIDALKSAPVQTLPFVAKLLGIEVAAVSPQQQTELSLAASAAQIKSLSDRLTHLEAHQR
jgi:capsid protein